MHTAAGRVRWPGWPCRDGVSGAEPVLVDHVAALADSRFMRGTPEFTSESSKFWRMTFTSPASPVPLGWGLGVAMHAPVVARGGHLVHRARCGDREPFGLPGIDTLVVGHGVDVAFTQKAGDRWPTRPQNVAWCPTRGLSGGGGASGSRRIVAGWCPVNSVGSGAAAIRFVVAWGSGVCVMLPVRSGGVVASVAGSACLTEGLRR